MYRLYSPRDSKHKRLTQQVKNAREDCSYIKLKREQNSCLSVTLTHREMPHQGCKSLPLECQNILQ